MRSGKGLMTAAGVSASGQSGFTLVWLLFAMLILGLGTQRVFVSVAQQHLSTQKRQQVRLLDLYNKALIAYREASPGTDQQFPLELQDLLLDTRQIQTRRYLRKLYPDPLQPGVDVARAWALRRDNKGRISAVYVVHRETSPASATAASQFLGVPS
jgi:type II secretory pathway pseudopilin PulG